MRQARHKAGVIVLGLIAMAAWRAPGAEPQDTVTVDAETAGVIHGALAYLARQQNADGSWNESVGLNPEPVAMTGYALMAYLSTGNLPDEGEYGRNVTAAMNYLLSEVGPDGLLRDVRQSKYMYSQGIATVALSELYGETRSPLLRQRLAQMVSVIVDGQSPLGGWRYTPVSQDADISVTVLQVAALRSAKNAGLAVPQDTIDRAIAYIGTCYDDGVGGFSYQPGREPGFARTAAAIYSLQVCGKYDDPAIKRGSDYLFANNDEAQEWWPYGCYYAAPAQYMLGGDVWRRWYGEMKTRLLASVIRDGDTNYWNEQRSRRLGPIYDTAVFITILAMPYHYIPLYQR